ncbi:MAG: threonine--tRNA ligase [Acidimicrobiaceae bacterium]|nr:threonine--tRNA ligase [Acidimicrobiaceae bacterium]
MEISVVLADGSERKVPSGFTVSQLATMIGKKLGADSVAAKINGILRDLDTVLGNGDQVQIITRNSDQGREVLRHSTAHVLAQAVTDLWPNTHYAIGPSIADGFYYDFELPDGQHFSDDDLTRIEARMREIVREDQTFARSEYSISEGLDLFAGQPFKLEIIETVANQAAEPEEEDLNEGVEVGSISVYRNSSGFIDLCRGPHVSSTLMLGSFKLMRVAGAYWRGNERRPQLQRIYGTAWESDKALKEHLVRLEEAEKRDHRRIGLELDLFHFPPEIGGGLPVFHPKGALIRSIMEDYSKREHRKAGYEFAWTPHIAKSTLFEISGHLGWYKAGMYPPMEMEGATYYPKPMNCPMHILIYKSKGRSYKELPLRLFEFGTVYRFERSGVLHGLARVRGLTQDDSHIFCSPDQLASELSRLLRFILSMLKTFGLSEFEAELATRPEKSVGEDYEWEYATSALEYALKESGIAYTVANGEGAFYAPKIDVHLKDAIGRRWQVSTLQVDLQMPQRFDMEFVDSDNTRKRPYMIHRALFGSVERFFAILLEHYAGALPVWLSPVQVAVLPVRDDHGEYANDVVNELKRSDSRVDYMAADEPLGSRIRKAKIEKVPYILVVGDADVAGKTVGVNARGSNDPERGVPLAEFIKRISPELNGQPLGDIVD